MTWLRCATRRDSFRELLKNGVFIPPSQFECNFISGAHTVEDLSKTAEAVEAALKVAWEL